MVAVEVDWERAMQMQRWMNKVNTYLVKQIRSVSLNHLQTNFRSESAAREQQQSSVSASHSKLNNSPFSGVNSIDPSSLCRSTTAVSVDLIQVRVDRSLGSCHVISVDGGRLMQKRCEDEERMKLYRKQRAKWTVTLHQHPIVWKWRRNKGFWSEERVCLILIFYRSCGLSTVLHPIFSFIDCFISHCTMSGGKNINTDVSHHTG